MTRNRIGALVADGYAGTRVDYGATITALRQAGLANVRLMLFEDLMADQPRQVTDLLDYLRITPEISASMVEAMATTSRKGIEAELPPEAAEQLRLALDGVYRDVAALGIDARHHWRYENAGRASAGSSHRLPRLDQGLQPGEDVAPAHR